MGLAAGGARTIANMILLVMPGSLFSVKIILWLSGIALSRPKDLMIYRNLIFFFKIVYLPHEDL